MNDNKFNQLCVMENTVLGDDTPEKFEKFFEEKGFRVKFAEEVKTNIINEDGEHSIDLFFYIHDDDIDKFAIPRLEMGIRWWEDILGNGHSKDYPKEILDKYPPKWNEENIEEEEEDIPDFEGMANYELIDCLRWYRDHLNNYKCIQEFNALVDVIQERLRNGY